MKNLPALTPEIKEHSLAVSAFIQNEIKKNQGLITFARFMELALYAPGLGYYSAGLKKFGEAGDFITAPEISSLFAYCLANQCIQIFENLNEPVILEFGAGTGILAANLLTYLKQKNALVKHYYILEVSPDLRQRQQQLLATLCPDLKYLVTWLDYLPNEKFEGIILANEVLDAMPVHRFQLNRNEIKEYYVGYDQKDFIWQRENPSSATLIQALEPIQNLLIDCDFYESEINLQVGPWLKSCAHILKKGAMLLIDYGFPRKEYYHPQRMGTLMCHIRHRAHSNPLIFAGIQDITAHVDFTKVAEAAAHLDLYVLGYTTQASFLLNSGLIEMVPTNNPLEQLKTANQIKKLTLPSEMGEIFKVIALGKDLNMDLIGFKQGDRRKSL